MKGPTKKRKNAGTDGSVDSSRSFCPIFTVGRTVGLHCLFTALNDVNGGKLFRFAQTVRFFQITIMVDVFSGDVPTIVHFLLILSFLDNKGLNPLHCWDLLQFIA